MASHIQSQSTSAMEMLNSSTNACSMLRAQSRASASGNLRTRSCGERRGDTVSVTWSVSRVHYLQRHVRLSHSQRSFTTLCFIGESSTVAVTHYVKLRVGLQV